MFDIVDRSRAEKISYHIRLPGYVIEKDKLWSEVEYLKRYGDKYKRKREIEYNTNILCNHIDTAIYR
jgi:hypothetical protein